MNDRTILAAGGLLVAVGVAGALAPGLMAGWSLATATVLFVGVIATVFAVRAARRRRLTNIEYVTLPQSGVAPEDAREPRSLGADVETALANAAPTRHRDHRTTLKNRLREDVTAALVARGTGPDAAEEAVEDGTWTTDPYAAAFLSDTVELPARDQLRLALTRDRVDRQVARVAAELDALTEVA